MQVITKKYLTLFILYLLNLNLLSQSLSWVETGPNPGTVLRWSTTAMSSDGSKIIAGVKNGKLYLSTDYGVTWGLTGPAPVYDFNWLDVAMSGDGLNIVAIIDMGEMFVTTDGGQNWQIPYGFEYNNYPWTTVSMSKSGEKVILGLNTQFHDDALQAFYSNNGGLTFYDAFSSVTGQAWSCSAVSENGNIIILGAYRWTDYTFHPGIFKKTTNGGESWEPMVAPVNQNWNTCAMNSDGTRIIIGSDEKLFVSSNSGSNWTEVQPAGEQALRWITTSMNDDGMKIIAGVSLGRLYISTNGGINWNETRPGGYDYNAAWSSANISSDGNKLLASVQGGRIWRNDGLFPVEIVSFNANYSEGIITLNWQTATEVNNYGFEVQRSVVSGQQSEEIWEKVGFVAGHGNSNSVKEYSFVDASTPLSASSISYRLKQIDNDGSFSYSETVEVKIENIPTEFVLYQNYPNPFNPSTSIEYSVPSSENVTLKVYDVLGNEVAHLVNEKKDAGNYRVNFNAASLSSGVYFYSINAGEFNQVRKMMLVK